MKRKQKKHSARKKTRKILRSSRRVQLKKQNTIENPEKLWEVANNHLLSDNPLGALPYLSKLVDFDPNDGILLFNYGACLAQTGDFQAATIPLEKAREIGTRIGQLPH